ncbi:MAG: MFS transporter [Flavobacterium nitrogenifigens]|uniref:MFS transporter n=1 Tax=Flavobacterium TaxID=237 RepID=UPI00236739AB|nr:MULTISPECIES: MFS transporter [Flavobacterium]MDQ8014449.1 MFS transporter [Flavobacterium nitrogenifigens]WDF64449.1 MFS transporter [Flavobacterium sp. KACC 22763]
MTEKIKTLQIIHLGICAGTIIAYFIVGDISLETLSVPAIDSNSILYLIIPVLAFVLSSILFKAQLKQIDPKLKLEDKLPVYQTASIMRWAVLEGAAFLILFIKPEFILFGILLIVYLLYLRPTEERITNDLSNS